MTAERCEPNLRLCLRRKRAIVDWPPSSCRADTPTSAWSLMVPNGLVSTVAACRTR